MNDHVVHELVIVRHRGGDDHEAHHGGVWKIAYADFMTAMMAFFLVMWLINAANEETKKAVASYFNPIKLVDVTSNPKGIQDLRYGGSSKDTSKQPTDSKSAPGNCQSQKAESDHSKVQSGTGTGASPAGLLGGSMPFPLGPADVPGPPSGDEPTIGGSAAVNDAMGAIGDRSQSSNPQADATSIAREVPEALIPATSSGASKRIADDQTAVVDQAGVKSAKDADDGVKTASEIAVAKAIDTSIRMELNRAGATSGSSIAVEANPEGILISITDQLDFSMFEVGSAKPNNELLKELTTIGRIVSSQPGQIVVRGHTDGRRYRTSGYDNWRLSSERAHVALELLESGGLAESRIQRVEGYADKRLRRKDDPLASENRRIEILIGRTPT